MRGTVRGVLRLWPSLEVQLAHDAIKGVVRLVSAKFAGRFIEAFRLTLSDFLHDLL